MEIIILVNMIIFGRLCHRIIWDLYERRGMELIFKEKAFAAAGFLAGVLGYGALVFFLNNIGAPMPVLAIAYIMPLALTAVIIRDF